MIAHRLNTIRNADWVYVLKDGEIIQQGTPMQLENEDGEYRHLWNMYPNV